MRFSAGIDLVLLVGVAAGWLAGQVRWGGGLGFFADLLAGVVGAFLGDLMLSWLGFYVGPDSVGHVANAAIGAGILIFSVRLAAASHARAGWSESWLETLRHRWGS